MDEWYFLGIFTDDLFWFFPSFFFFSLFLFLNVKFREDLGLDLNFWVVDPFKNLVIQTLSLKMDLHIYQKELAHNFQRFIEHSHTEIISPT